MTMAKSNRIACLFTAVLLLAGSRTTGATNWSAAGSACGRLFMSISAADLAVAQRTIKASPEAIQRLTIPAVLEVPRLIALRGGDDKARSRSILEGLFPLLHAREMSVARFDGHDLNTLTNPYGFISRKPSDRYLKRADRLLMFDLLVIDAVRLPALNEEGRKNLSTILNSRFALGRSTIIVERDQTSLTTLSEFLKENEFKGVAEEVYQ